MNTTSASISVQSPKRRIRNFNEVVLGFSKRAALEEARRCPQCSQPECMAACPLGINIPLFIRYLREGHIDGAYRQISEANPFAGICGRVCHAPCEAKCILQQEGAPMSIRALERFAYDHGHKKELKRPAEKTSAKKVAVIGSGPCGLTAASRLAREHFEVTVFESLPAAGGFLRYGIPEMRLPQAVLEKEIAALKRLGVHIQEHKFMCDLDLAGLTAQGYVAVILAAGYGGISLPPLQGVFYERVYLVEEILLQHNFLRKDIFEREMLKKVGERVVVIGGNDKAWDAARLCRRLGREAMVVFPGPQEDLPFHHLEMEQGQEEGVELKALTKPMEILADSQGRAVGIRCLNMDYADVRGDGPWRLIPVPGSDFVLEADTVILAEGQNDRGVFAKVFPGIDLNAQVQGTVPPSRVTAKKDVFVVGSMNEDGLSLVAAMQRGKAIAQTVVRHLTEKK